jgi:hypothetical protein
MATGTLAILSAADIQKILVDDLWASSLGGWFKITEVGGVIYRSPVAPPEFAVHETIDPETPQSERGFGT